VNNECYYFLNLNTAMLQIALSCVNAVWTWFLFLICMCRVRRALLAQKEKRATWVKLAIRVLWYCNRFAYICYMIIPFMHFKHILIVYM